MQCLIWITWHELQTTVKWSVLESQLYPSVYALIQKVKNVEKDNPEIGTVTLQRTFSWCPFPENNNNNKKKTKKKKQFKFTDLLGEHFLFNA